jgi:Leucine-rich repeat (LRR) protein
VGAATGSRREAHSTGTGNNAPSHTAPCHTAAAAAEVLDMALDGTGCVDISIRDLPWMLDDSCGLPQALFDLTVLSGLTKLCITCTNICELPPSIVMLTSLKELDVSHNQVLEAVTEDIGEMVWLNVLRLENTDLLELPSSIGKLTGLKILDLESCKKLQAVPKEIGSMVGLRVLNLSQCALKEVPSSIGNLTRLEMLFLDGCEKLEELPEDIAGMVALKQLDLKFTALKELPSSIGKLTGLEILDLHSCIMLQALPKEIGSMVGLRTLFLRECLVLKEIPSSIGNLTGLEALLLPRFNEQASLKCCLGMIEALPQEIGRMVGLKALNLDGCRLGDAGESIITGILRTNHSIEFLFLRECGIQEGGVLAIGRAIKETPRAPRETFNISGIELNGVAAMLGVPVESGNEDDWSNFSIIRWMLGNFVVWDTVIAFLTAQICNVVEEYRPRPLDGSGNSVIPAVSALSQDNMKQIGKLFMDMQTQERLQQFDLETYRVDSETESEDEGGQ